MSYLVVKYLLTAAVVVLVSELAKRSDKLGGLIAALPLMTIMVLIWLYLERQPLEKLQNHAWYTFWYVLPTLPMFLALPWLLSKLAFWPSLALCSLLTIGCFLALAALLRNFSIDLM